MSDQQQPTQAITSKRIVSIDVLRGITILVMLFVNDVAGVNGTPKWMRHVSAATDGMTFVDVVFPAFLFIVGMAIPFAIGKRFEQGQTLRQIWKHVLVRTLGLLVIGVVMVNSEIIAENGIINSHVWFLLAYLAVILIWNTAHGPHSKLISRLQIVGGIALVALVFLFRAEDGSGIIQMQTRWWGILGLIGWAYLVSILIYIPLRKNLAGLVGSIALLYSLYAADRAGLFSEWTWINSWINIGGTLGSHAAIVMSGVVLGMILRPDSPVQTHGERIRWAFFYGLGLTLAGILLHALNDIDSMFIINKIQATIPWCLFTSAITLGVWIFIYWVMDVKGWKKWAKIVEPAGKNPLFAYILAPVFHSIFALIALSGFDFWAKLGSSFPVGFMRSLVFAFAMTFVAGWLRKIGVWLKL
jgi:heparan-alpha-glucosaminide N-acetyltransferase